MVKAEDKTYIIFFIYECDLGAHFFRSDIHFFGQKKKGKKGERPMLFLLPMRALGKFKQAFLRQRGAQARSWPAA
jgi:hypothetical protein